MESPRFSASHDPDLRHGTAFTRITDNDAFRALKPVTRLIYFALTTYAEYGHGDTFPSQTRLAKQVGVDTRTTARALKELHDGGFVFAEWKEPSPGRGRYHYFLLARVTPPVRASVPPGEGTGAPRLGDREPPVKASRESTGTPLPSYDSGSLTYQGTYQGTNQKTEHFAAEAADDLESPYSSPTPQTASPVDRPQGITPPKAGRRVKAKRESTPESKLASKILGQWIDEYKEFDSKPRLTTGMDLGAAKNIAKAIIHKHGEEAEERASRVVRTAWRHKECREWPYKESNDVPVLASIYRHLDKFDLPGELPTPGVTLEEYYANLERGAVRQ